jgi:hypothetical protein
VFTTRIDTLLKFSETSRRAEPVRFRGEEEGDAEGYRVDLDFDRLLAGRLEGEDEKRLEGEMGEREDGFSGSVR